MSVADWLLEHNITVTGTIRADRKGIPLEMKQSAGRMPKSTKWCYIGKKNACFLWGQEKWCKDENQDGFFAFNHARWNESVKRSVSKTAAYCLLRPHEWWRRCSGPHIGHGTRVQNNHKTMNALFDMLSTLRTNCHTLYNEVNKMKNSSFKSKNTFDFTRELGKALTLPWIRERYKNTHLDCKVASKWKCTMFSR